ncbi:hypothetical protein CGLAMM_05065 [Acetobacteraceae bacterium EV16G]|uniref:Uncharacterized protein n=1 Tax=Sorlinia euscelidii TaxID=3081148 RepID=A0ABU7U175_9PROT
MTVEIKTLIASANRLAKEGHRNEAERLIEEIYSYYEQLTYREVASPPEDYAQRE